MTKVVCDICGKEIDKRAIHLHMRIHEKEKGGEVGEGGKIYDYHVLFPDLVCVVKDGDNVYTAPVLAIHISAKGGWMIVCDKNGKVMRSEDVSRECYICNGKKEAQRLMKLLMTAREGREVRGMFARIVDKLLQIRRRKTEQKEETVRELSEESVAELVSVLREFASKARKEGEEDEF